MGNNIYLRAFEYSDLSFLNKLRNNDRNYQMLLAISITSLLNMIKNVIVKCVFINK